jgi:hypothetical protein
MSQTSRHHIPSASAWAHPGRGRSIEWATVSEAKTDPEASTSTPFVLPVPISMPTNTSTWPPYVWVQHQNRCIITTRDLSNAEARRLALMGGVALVSWLTAVGAGRIIEYW